MWTAYYALRLLRAQQARASDSGEFSLPDVFEYLTGYGFIAEVAQLHDNAAMVVELAEEWLEMAQEGWPSAVDALNTARKDVCEWLLSAPLDAPMPYPVQPSRHRLRLAMRWWLFGIVPDRIGEVCERLQPFDEACRPGLVPALANALGIDEERAQELWYRCKGGSDDTRS